MPRRLVQSI